MKLILISLSAAFCFANVFGAILKFPFSTLDLKEYKKEGIQNFRFLNVDRNDVTFRLWTRDNKHIFKPIYYGHLKDAVNFRNQQAVKIIIHGWTDSADKEWYGTLIGEYLKKDDYNVIGVDWSKPASALYPLSAKYTKDVGRYVGELLVDLHKTLGVPLENIHVIGHSLGAHISGFAGQYVKETLKNTIGRITGLDPAGPLFLLVPKNGRLSTDDATFVDVIHTDAGKLGLDEKIGHIDFYPNGGSAPQPGCLMYNEIIDAASCSHTRSYRLFGESVNSDEFKAAECGSFNDYEHGKCDGNPIELMGENADTSAEGAYYLATNTEPPYAKN